MGSKTSSGSGPWVTVPFLSGGRVGFIERVREERSGIPTVVDMIYR